MRGDGAEQGGLLVEEEAIRDAAPLAEIPGEFQLGEGGEEGSGGPGMEGGAAAVRLDAEIDPELGFEVEDLVEEVGLEFQGPSVQSDSGADEDGGEVEAAFDAGAEFEEVLGRGEGRVRTRAASGGDVPDVGEFGVLEEFPQKESVLGRIRRGAFDAVKALGAGLGQRGGIGAVQGGEWLEEEEKHSRRRVGPIALPKTPVQRNSGLGSGVAGNFCCGMSNPRGDPETTKTPVLIP